MEISKTSQKLHFRVTKKDTGFHFHFHDLYLFKSWSNLGFDQDSNVHQNSIKNQKNEKPKHIVFLCHIHIYSKHSKVDKQGLARHIQIRQIMYLPL
jgi:hypothetical protein